MKKCCECKTKKPLTEFGKNRSLKDGLAKACKSCMAARGKAYRDSGYYREQSLRKNYGLTPEQYDILRESQNYKCKICEIPEEMACKNKLFVDHCHTTGRVRGLLCHNCNTAIGLLGDRIDSLEAAIKYLKA